MAAIFRPDAGFLALLNFDYYGTTGVFLWQCAGPSLPLYFESTDCSGQALIPPYIGGDCLSVFIDGGFANYAPVQPIIVQQLTVQSSWVDVRQGCQPFPNGTAPWELAVPVSLPSPEPGVTYGPN
ncbi:MAG: hypothetical protein QM723_34315 [Myxococcaceae bacterium]